MTDAARPGVVPWWPVQPTTTTTTTTMPDHPLPHAAFDRTGQAEAFALDVTQDAQFAPLFDAIAARLGAPPSIQVHNAGILNRPGYRGGPLG